MPGLLTTFLRTLHRGLEALREDIVEFRRSTHECFVFTCKDDNTRRCPFHTNEGMFQVDPCYMLYNDRQISKTIESCLTQCLWIMCEALAFGVPDYTITGQLWLLSYFLLKLFILERKILRDIEHAADRGCTLIM